MLEIDDLEIVMREYRSLYYQNDPVATDDVLTIIAKLREVWKSAAGSKTLQVHMLALAKKIEDEYV